MPTFSLFFAARSLVDEPQLAPRELKLRQVADNSTVLLNASAMLLEFVPLNTSNFAAGTYFIHLIINGNEFEQKFVKQ